MNQKRNFKLPKQLNYLMLDCKWALMVSSCAPCEVQNEHKDKLLAPNWDSLQKHANWKKTKIYMKGVKKSE
jgi:hypothetical protein